MRTVVLRVAALALLLLLTLSAVLSVRTLRRLPNSLVYFVVSEEVTFRLEPVGRRLRGREPEARAREALEALIGGPTPAEQASGLASAVPPGTRVLDVRRDGDTLEVDLSSEFASGGGTASMQARLYQVLYTVTQPRGVAAVRLRIDGAPLRELGGEGVIVEQPWRRAEHPALPIW